MSKHTKAIQAKLIVNPGAGNALKVATRLEAVTRYLKEDGVSVDVAFAAPKREATLIARKAVKAGYDTVIAMGGDGTISAVIRGIAGSKVRLGIIAAGTMNDVAKSLDIPLDLKEACALIASGQTRKMDLGQVKIGKNKKLDFFMVTAIGLTATMFPKVKKMPKGHFGGLTDAILTFLKYDTKSKVFLTLDDESKVEVETMLVTVANLPLMGSMNLMAPDASPEDGLLDISVYPDFSKAELLTYFARTTNEGSSPDAKLQRYKARKLTVKASPKMEVAGDGIKLGKGTARIKVRPGALRVIAPQPVVRAKKSPKETAPAHLPGGQD